MIMKNSKKFIMPILIVSVLVIFAVVIWQSSGGKTFEFGTSKNTCDYRFLEWCKGYPAGGVDYDNFAVANRDCTGQGSYRTCDQVREALS